CLFTVARHTPHPWSGLTRRPPGAPLIPYTTLFRSRGDLPGRAERGLCNRYHFARQWWYVHVEHPERMAPSKVKSVQINRHATRRSEEHTSELQSREQLVCRLRLEKKKSLRRHPQRR